MGAIVDKPNQAVKSYPHAYSSGHISTSQEAQNGIVALVCPSHLRPCGHLLGENAEDPAGYGRNTYEHAAEHAAPLTKADLSFLLPGHFQPAPLAESRPWPAAGFGSQTRRIFTVDATD